MDRYNTVIPQVVFIISLLFLACPSFSMAGQVTIIDPQTGKMKTYTRTDSGNTSTYWDNETGDWEVVERTGKTIMDNGGNMNFYQSDDPDWYYKESNSKSGLWQDLPGFKQETE